MNNDTVLVDAALLNSLAIHQGGTWLAANIHRNNGKVSADTYVGNMRNLPVVTPMGFDFDATPECVHMTRLRLFYRNASGIWAQDDDERLVIWPTTYRNTGKMAFRSWEAARRGSPCEDTWLPYASKGGKNGLTKLWSSGTLSEDTTIDIELADGTQHMDVGRGAARWLLPPIENEMGIVQVPNIRYVRLPWHKHDWWADQPCRTRLTAKYAERDHVEHLQKMGIRRIMDDV